MFDLAKVTLENLDQYQESKKKKRGQLSKKEYQHKYYLEVTKPKRKAKKWSIE